MINYFYIIKNHPLEFDRYKIGVMGLCSKYLFDNIKNGQIQPRNAIERAYLFYYRTKLSFAGQNVNYIGINYKSRDSYKSLDSGLLNPLDERVIKRLRYVNLVDYPFEKCYDLFERALLKKEDPEKVFFYCDPPYVGTEDYYSQVFTRQHHGKLIDILLNTKFKFMLSIGGNCDFYLNSLSSFNIKEVKVIYSANATAQYERKEYLIMNYDIKKVRKMITHDQQDIMQFMEV